MQRSRMLIALRAGAALLAIAAATGCTHRLVEIPFDVARHVAVESVKLPIDTAEIATKGVLDALTKR